MRQHTHRAVESKDEDRGFSFCANPHRCSPASHGNITRTRFCSCGAQQWVNVNMGHVERSIWFYPDDSMRFYPDDES